jgi:azurin
MLRPFLLAFLASLAPFALGADPSKPAKPSAPKPTRIQIEIVPGALRYATTRFDVKAGAELELTLKNTCIMPHNLVLGRPDKANDIVVQAMAMGNEGMAKDFIPDSADVIVATKIVSPGLAKTLRFKAPAEPGEYPYLCTFPGHGTIMRGIMRVRPEGEKLENPVVEKWNAVTIVDALKASAVTSHPMGTRQHPFVLRSFVPDPKLGDEVLAHHDHAQAARPYNPSIGQDIDGKDISPDHGVPAGIAVNFGPDFSYVWDATECRLLYAWTGGFLDMSAYWGDGTGGGRRSFAYVPELDGTLVYKAAGPLPLRLGDGKTRPKFRGYRMVSGTPEFAYEIGGVTVHEHIIPADPGTFMIHYRVERPPDSTRLVFDPAIRAQVSCEQGSWKGDTLEIPADHGDHFMLLVRFAPGETFKPNPNAGKKKSTSEAP